MSPALWLGGFLPTAPPGGPTVALLQLCFKLLLSTTKENLVVLRYYKSLSCLGYYNKRRLSYLLLHSVCCGGSI